MKNNLINFYKIILKENKMKENSYRQILFEELTGKLKMITNENKTYKCNIYGEKSGEFLQSITGFASYKKRKNLGVIKDIELVCDNSLYRPQNTKFEGYSQFSRPLSQPFFNEKVNEEVKKNMINTFLKTNKFSVDRNKNLLNLKSNQGLQYYTSSVAKHDDSSKNIFISQIDDHIQKCKDEYKYKISQFHSDPTIKALKKLKRVLKDNSENKMVNGRQLNSPNKSFEKKFKTTFDLLRNRRDNFKYLTNYGRIEESEKIVNHAAAYDSKTFGLRKNNRSDVSFNNQDDPNENIKIKRKSSLDKLLKEENDLIQGFKFTIRKEPRIIYKSCPRKIRTAGESYIEDMKLLQKVNPIAFENQKQKEIIDRKVFETKRNQNLIGQKNLGF